MPTINEEKNTGAKMNNSVSLEKNININTNNNNTNANNTTLKKSLTKKTKLSPVKKSDANDFYVKFLI